MEDKQACLALVKISACVRLVGDRKKVLQRQGCGHTYEDSLANEVPGEPCAERIRSLRGQTVDGLEYEDGIKRYIHGAQERMPSHRTPLIYL